MASYFFFCYVIADSLQFMNVFDLDQRGVTDLSRCCPKNFAKGGKQVF